MKYFQIENDILKQAMLLIPSQKCDQEQLIQRLGISNVRIPTIVELEKKQQFDDVKPKGINNCSSELNNKLISKVLQTLNIPQSLNIKCCSYDNAVAEAMFKIIKKEFVNGKNL